MLILQKIDNQPQIVILLNIDINSFKKYIPSILVICIILVAIPLTIITSQNQQILTQEAAAPKAKISPPTPSPTPEEKRLTVIGTVVEKNETSFTLKDSIGALTKISFIPSYTKIYQLPGNTEYSSKDLPLGIYMSGTVLTLPKEKSTSGNNEFIGEIFHLPVKSR